MGSQRRRLWLGLAAALIATGSLVGSAHAASGRVSEADAKAVLKSIDPSLDPEVRVAIRPHSGSVYDGRHYCALDWHVALIAWLHAGDASFTKKDAAASLGNVSVTLVLNGTQIATQRTKVKQFAAGSYYFQEGTILSPDDLAVGQHALAVSVTDPRDGNYVDQITFFIDAPGTGACI
jgi:hypothetical protein